jgi:hypothetical protein
LALSLIEILAATFQLAAILPISSINLGAGLWIPLSSIVALIGLLGFYPNSSANPSPLIKWSKVSLGIAAVINLGQLISNILYLITQWIGLVGWYIPLIRSLPITIISLIATVATFLALSYYLRRTDSHPQLLGFLLLMPAFTSVGWLGVQLLGHQIIPISISTWISVSFFSINMLAYTGIGYVVQNPDQFRNIQLGKLLNNTQHRNA